MMAARSSVLMIWGMIVYLKLSSAQWPAPTSPSPHETRFRFSNRTYDADGKAEGPLENSAGPRLGPEPFPPRYPGRPRRQAVEQLGIAVHAGARQPDRQAVPPLIALPDQRQGCRDPVGRAVPPTRNAPINLPSTPSPG